MMRTGLLQSWRRRMRRPKQRQIIEAARYLFFHDGYESTTVDSIAARASVTRDTVYEFAPTKLQLLVLVYEYELAQRVQRAFLSREPTTSPWASLACHLSALFTLYERDVELARRVVQQQLFAGRQSPDIAQRLLLWNLREFILTWQRDGYVTSELDATVAAQNTHALYFDVLVGWLCGRIPEGQRDLYLRLSLELYWRGLTREAQA